MKPENKLRLNTSWTMETSCKICGGQHITGACKEKKKEVGQKIQYLPRFEEFKGGKVDEAGKYAEPSPERKAEIERRLDQLGDIMDGASFDYHLDGAINVSLLQKKFIRDHKDVDISVADDDLQALDEQIKKKGYVIVYADRDKYTETHRCLEVVSAKEIAERKLGELQIAKVDKQGKIKDDYAELNFIDLHVPHRTDNGDIIIGGSGVSLPAKYFQRIEKYHTQGGHEIPVSHPVVIAYHKVESGRDYDFQDISHLRDYLTDEDKKFLVGIFEQEPERKVQQYLPMIKKMFASVNPGMRPDEILSQLEKSGVGKDPDGRVFIDEFPANFKGNPDMGEEEFVRLFTEKVKLKEKLETRAKEKIDKLRKALEG